MNNLLQPGIKEAMFTFWEWHDSRIPQTIKNDFDKMFINECLILALGTLNSIVKRKNNE